MPKFRILLEVDAHNKVQASDLCHVGKLIRISEVRGPSGKRKKHMIKIDGVIYMILLSLAEAKRKVRVS